jgi:hypothetical protein
MPQTLIPPSSLDENSLERLIVQMSGLPRDSGTLNLDLGRVEFIDPCGMVGLLELGRYFAQQGHKLLLHLPLSMEVQRCLDQMEFFRHLSEFYIMYPPYRPLAARARQVQQSDVLLEITRIAQSDDIPRIIGKVKERTRAILEAHLHYKEDAIQGFLVALHEICQNILEHSQNTGLAGIQKYFDEKHLNKNAVKVAVMDLGIGFKGSLSSRPGLRHGEQWSDIAALEEALLNGAGRGHGLATVKEFVQRWGGKLSIRSGTARLLFLSDREHGSERETGLSEFPGVLISLVLSEV